MIPLNAPVDPTVVRRRGPIEGAAAAAAMLDQVAALASAATVREHRTDEHRSVIAVEADGDEIRWTDFRKSDGGPTNPGTQPELVVKRRGDLRLKVRLRNSALRTLIGADEPTQIAALAEVLADLCRVCGGIDRSMGVEKDIRLTAGAYLSMRDPPLRDDHWLGIGLRLPSPWSPASVQRVSPGLETDVSTDTFPRWGEFSSRLPTLLEVVPSVQTDVVTVSISPMDGPLLKPTTVVDSLRLVSRWEDMTHYEPLIAIGAAA